MSGKFFQNSVGDRIYSVPFWSKSSPPEIHTEEKNGGAVERTAQIAELSAIARQERDGWVNERWTNNDSATTLSIIVCDSLHFPSVTTRNETNLAGGLDVISIVYVRSLGLKLTCKSLTYEIIFIQRVHVSRKCHFQRNFQVDFDVSNGKLLLVRW